MSRIGVFVCHCGLNIAKTVRVSELAEFAATLPDVVVARDYKFMCSTPGQEMIQRDIKEYKLDRVIVTACSPLMHEKTFRKVIENAGLNQYLLTIVNIREQLSWVTHDIEEGTAKAKALLNGAVYRARLLAPLTSRVIDVNPDVLVVGGGIAGIQAALELANTGTKVYLVEKNSTIGGHMAQFDKTFPTLDCSACILTLKWMPFCSTRTFKCLPTLKLQKSKAMWATLISPLNRRRVMSIITSVMPVWPVRRNVPAKASPNGMKVW